MDNEALGPMTLGTVEQIIEGGARLGAAIFLAVVLLLLFRAKRRSRSDLLLGAVFGSWLVVILFNAARFVLGFPPQYLHWSVYVLITALEVVAIVSMVRESNRIRHLRDREIVADERESAVTSREGVMGEREDVMTGRESVVTEREAVVTEREGS